eukprot:1836620-Amphidinium_carterae.1
MIAGHGESLYTCPPQLEFLADSPLLSPPLPPPQDAMPELLSYIRGHAQPIVIFLRHKDLGGKEVPICDKP